MLNMPADGIVEKKVLKGKDGLGVEVLVVIVNHKKFPMGDYKWGKRNYKISNFKHFKLKVGDAVSGTLFKHQLYPVPEHSIRFHILTIKPSM